MKISELVQKLSELRALHGDLEVMLSQSAIDREGTEHIWNARIMYVDRIEDNDGTFIEIC